jgi:hypothetical protein
MHFEDIWNEAEQTATSTEGLGVSMSENIENIKKICESILENKIIETTDIGEILFQLCSISAKANINVAAALNEVKKQNELESFND